MPETPLPALHRGLVNDGARIAGGPAPASSAMVVRAALVLLLLATAGLGYLGISLVRPLFVMGCVAVAYLASREGPARSVEISIVLFTVSPFLRRLADFGLGYEPSGYMLLGPLLAILVPTVDLARDLRSSARMNKALVPLLAFGSCAAYGIVLSAIKGDLTAAATGGIKTIAPLLFGIWITRNSAHNQSVIDAASRAFVVVMPVLGLYGLWQYVDPAPWDRYWMLQSQMDSIGAPEPYSVRVFSTFNSPASFAAYCVFSLLLICYCRSGWLAVVAALPIGLGLLLTSSRTHWLALVIGILYCSAFAKTRSRSVLLAILLAVSVGVASLAGPEIADSIAQRLETLTGSVSEDGSGAARLDQFAVIYSSLDDLMFGAGLGENGASLRAGLALDGEISGAIVRLGYIVGTISIACLVWAIVLGLGRIGWNSKPQIIVLGAVLAGSLLQLLLASLTSGEVGFLFWLSIGLTASAKSANSPLERAPRYA